MKRVRVRAYPETNHDHSVRPKTDAEREISRAVDEATRMIVRVNREALERLEKA